MINCSENKSQITLKSALSIAKKDFWWMNFVQLKLVMSFLSHH